MMVQPPTNLTEFFARFPQSPRRLSTGERVDMPLFIWGHGILELLGSVNLEKVTPYLSHLEMTPVVLQTTSGPAALAGLVSPSYTGSTLGPYNGFFFGIFVKDQGWDARDPEPGFVFLEFYDNSKLSTAAGELWGIRKTFARVDCSYDSRVRRASAAVGSRVVASMTWRSARPFDRGVGIERRFRTFSGAGVPPSRVLLAGAETGGPFRRGADDFVCDPRTPFGITLTGLGFVPREWRFSSEIRGVYFLPDRADRRHLGFVMGDRA